MNRNKETCSHFPSVTEAQERERERERERICKGLWTDTKRHAQPTPSPTELSECKLLTTDRLVNWLLFQNLLNFIYLNSGYCWGRCHLAKLLRHLLHVPNSIKPVTDKIRINFVYIPAFRCWTLCIRLNFLIWLTFPL